MKKFVSIALMLALLLMSTAAFAADTDSASKITNTVAGQVATTPKTHVATITPDIVIDDPGTVSLKIEWTQPKLSFAPMALDYSKFTFEDGAAELTGDQKAALAPLGVTDEDLKAFKIRGVKYENFDAMKTALAALTAAHSSVNYYCLAADVETKFTLTNASVSGAVLDSEKYFQGLLKIEAEQTDDAKTKTTLKKKGVTTELKTPMEGEGEAAKATALQLKSLDSCKKLADISGKATDSEEYKAIAGQYIDNTSYSFTYKDDKEFVPYLTMAKGADGNITTTPAEFYSTTPQVDDVQGELTAYITFKVDVIKEAKDAYEAKEEPAA